MAARSGDPRTVATCDGRGAGTCRGDLGTGRTRGGPRAATAGGGRRVASRRYRRRAAESPDGLCADPFRGDPGAATPRNGRRAATTRGRRRAATSHGGLRANPFPGNSGAPKPRRGSSAAPTGGGCPAATPRHRHPAATPHDNRRATRPVAAPPQQRSVGTVAGGGSSIRSRPLPRSSGPFNGPCGCWSPSQRTSTGAPAKQLARETGLALPTAYHLLRTLVHEGYLRRDKGLFFLGGRRLRG